MYIKRFLYLLIFSFMAFSSVADEFESYLNSAFKSRHFNALIYQFRFSESYQYVMSENYDLETMKRYANQGDAFANVVLYRYYSDTKQNKKAEKASLNVFVQTVPSHQYMVFQNAMFLFAQAEKNTAKEAAYLTYLRDDLSSRIDDERLNFLVSKHGQEKVDKKLKKLKGKIKRLSEKLPKNVVRWAVEPLHIQKRKEG